MPNYLENPKTAGSGIVCAIPQSGLCPNNCKDCFFQSGQSYLEPLASNLPNMPPGIRSDQIVRVNDGNDSNNDWATVVHSTDWFGSRRFFNTSQPKLDFPAPIVLTLNPGEMTDKSFFTVHPIPANLMFLRWRANTWNLSLLGQALAYYTSPVVPGVRQVPIILTWMCYPHHEDIPAIDKHNYELRKHVSNNYWQIKPGAWKDRMSLFSANPWVYSCGSPWASTCSFCGNCIREWHNTTERMERKDG
jgi:hypothetical protein